MNIFEGIEENSQKSLLKCLRAVKKSYKKGEIIFDIGDTITSVGYIIEGSVQLAKDDYNGNKIIISSLYKNDSFAHSIVCAGIKESPLCVSAISDVQILFLDFKRILNTCTNACEFHQRLINNIIFIISKKNLFLESRLELLSKKTIRERILYFLENERRKHASSLFEIPYSREKMSEYLCVDRSALSRELSVMKKEGLLDYHKNHFRIS